LLQKGLAEVSPVLSMARLNTDSLLECAQTLGNLAIPHERDAKIVEGFRVRRLDLDGSL
jgi:hypothetical protein